jgi:starvation-inducible DNA-binding protein
MKAKVDIGISEKHREEISKGLSHFLADTYTLYLKTHNYHWNVTGPMFQTLHLMFEGQYNELAVAVDDIAERIRALGYKAPATYQEFVKLTMIKENTNDLSALQMVSELVLGHEQVIKTARGLFGMVNEAHDEPTADILIQRLRVHEKTAWMLRSMLET